MRRLLLNLHLYTALVAGVFALILGATGCIMAFEPELDHLFHARLSYVAPQGRARSLAEIGEIVTKAFPGERIAGYNVPADPDLAVQASLRRGAVCVNQYTGEILGVRPTGPDFLSRVHQLHLRLLILNRADPGKIIMSWAGVAVLFLALSGLYLWWPLKRFSINKNRFLLDVHHVSGIFSFAFLLILSLTGIMIGFERTFVPMFYSMTGSQPSPRPEIPSPPPGAKPIPLDQAMDVARAAIPGATPFQINVPPPQGAYQILSRFPEDRTPGGRSRVVVDQYTGRVLFAEGSRTAPAGSRIIIANRALHTGDMFGIPSKIIVSLASLLVVVQWISGLWIWLKRRSPATRVAYENASR
jgi:uncharacterized iron-regulated membrane protein